MRPGHPGDTRDAEQHTPNVQRMVGGPHAAHPKRAADGWWAARGSVTRSGLRGRPVTHLPLSARKWLLHAHLFTTVVLAPQ